MTDIVTELVEIVHLPSCMGSQTVKTFQAKTYCYYRKKIKSLSDHLLKNDIANQ